ncbi:MAG: hypothetical protein Q4P28_04980 [Tissierellia bacterium]|nr:hypothetical protein [Tissierellia bacterium]
MKIPKKQLNLLLSLILILIILESVEVLMLAKDQSLMKEFQALTTENLQYDDYLSFHLMNYFRGIHIPIILGLFTYFGRKSLRFGHLYKIVFGLLMMLSIMMHFIGHHFRTILFYPIIGLQILLFFVLINLTQEERDGKD